MWTLQNEVRESGRLNIMHDTFGSAPDKTFYSSMLVPILKYVFLFLVYRCMFCFLVSYDYYVNVCFYLRLK